MTTMSEQPNTQPDEQQPEQTPEQQPDEQSEQPKQTDSSYVPPFTDGVDVPAPDPVEPVEPVTEGNVALPVDPLPASEPVYFPPVEADEPEPEGDEQQ